MFINAPALDSTIDFAVVAGDKTPLAVEPGADADAVAGWWLVVIPAFPGDRTEFRRVARFGGGPDIWTATEVGFDGADAVAFPRKGEEEIAFLPSGLFGMDDGGEDVCDLSVPPRGEQIAFHEVDGDIGGCIGGRERSGNRFLDFKKMVVDEGNRIADRYCFQANQAKERQVKNGEGYAMPGNKGPVVSGPVVYASKAVRGVVPRSEPDGVVAAGVGIMAALGRLMFP